jgi:L-amino acid N-acyltransferase YncA
MAGGGAGDEDVGVEIRAATGSDAAAIAAIYAEGIEEGKSTFETRPHSAAEMRARVDAPGEIHLVAEDGGRVVGWATTAPYSTRDFYAGIAEATIYVFAASRGRGIGTALVGALADEARRRGLHKLLGKLFVENDASRRLLARCGFRDVGVHVRHGRHEGEWRDVLLVELLL